MANENEPNTIEREFYYLDSSVLTYKRVLAHSREAQAKGMWYLPTEHCTVKEGFQIFTTLIDLYRAAESAFEQQERRFNSIRRNFNTIKDDVNF